MAVLGIAPHLSPDPSAASLWVWQLREGGQDDGWEGYGRRNLVDRVATQSQVLTLLRCSTEGVDEVTWPGLSDIHTGEWQDGRRARGSFCAIATGLPECFSAVSALCRPVLGPLHLVDHQEKWSGLLNLGDRPTLCICLGRMAIANSSNH